MPIYPISSANISFGKKNNNKKQTALLPGAAGGAVIGGLTAHLTKIKFNKDNLETGFKTVSEKLPMSDVDKDTFDNLKDYYDTKNSEIKDIYNALNITNETKEIPSQNVLNHFIDCKDDKSLKKLGEEIAWIQGELTNPSAFSPEELVKKQRALKEKIDMKVLVDEAEKNNNMIAVSKIKNYYEKNLKFDSKIKNGLKNVNTLVTRYNKQRTYMFPVIGLVLGAILGSFITITTKNKN